MKSVTSRASKLRIILGFAVAPLIAAPLGAILELLIPFSVSMSGDPKLAVSLISSTIISYILLSYVIEIIIILPLLLLLLRFKVQKIRTILIAAFIIAMCVPGILLGVDAVLRFPNSPEPIFERMVTAAMYRGYPFLLRGICVALIFNFIAFEFKSYAQKTSHKDGENALK